VRQSSNFDTQRKVGRCAAKKYRRFARFVRVAGDSILLSRIVRKKKCCIDKNVLNAARR